MKKEKKGFYICRGYYRLTYILKHFYIFLRKIYNLTRYHKNGRDKNARGEETLCGQKREWNMKEWNRWIP